MNTWRDIKTTPLNQLVLTTDGTDVYKGQIDCDLIFRGEKLADSEYAAFNIGSLTGWQPAPATFQPEKSADEMFRELGYKKVDDLEDNVTRYVRYPYEIRWIQGRVFKFHNGYGKDGLTDNEVLACAQLIKEMEETK